MSIKTMSGVSRSYSRDRRDSVARFANHLAAKGLDHFGQILAREDRIVHDQIAHRLIVPASFNGSKLFHDTPPLLQLKHEPTTFG